MAQVRVVRKGVTAAELASVLSRRLGDEFQVVAESGDVLVRRSALSSVIVRIKDVPGATVFRVRGVGLLLTSYWTARVVADALRRSPEFRSV